ncbi:YodC family protein [Vibrio splendidus]
MFNLGDRVQLASGGPIMTVSDVDSKSIECQWFDKKGELKVSEFIAETLKKYVEPDLSVSVGLY